MDFAQAAERKQRLVWVGALAAISLVGVAQRDHRALLSGPETPGLSASAFAAITPQSAGVPAAGGGGVAGRQSAPHRGTAGGASADYGVPGGTLALATPGATPGGAPSVFDTPETPSALVALADPQNAAATGSGTTNGPVGGGGAGGASTIAAGGTNTTTTSTTTTGTTSIGGGTTTTTVAGTDPGAVPEAPMWMMMILGLGGIGIMARKRRAQALVPVAIRA